MKRKYSIILMVFCLLGLPIVTVAISKNIKKEDAKLKTLNTNTTDLSAEQIHLMKYDPELFTLTYSIFIANKEIEKAYHLAKTAVAKNPQDLEWREKLAKTSRWNSKPKESLDHWMYLATHRVNNDTDINEGIKVAQALKDYDSLIDLYQLKLKKNLSATQKLEIQDAMANAYNESGNPDKAIELISEIPVLQRSTSEALLLIKLYHETYHPQKEIIAIDQYEKKFELTQSLAIQKAVLLSRMGKETQAFNTLNNYKNTHEIKDPVFWKAFANLSWRTQNLDQAYQSYGHLFQLKDFTAPEAERLIFSEEHNPQKAYEHALESWYKFHTDLFYLNVLKFGTFLKKWPQLNKIIHSLTPEERKQFGSNKDIFHAELEVYIGSQNWKEADRLFAIMFVRWPHDNDIKITYLWYLIDRENIVDLRKRLIQWQSIAIKNEPFWLPFGLAYVLLKENDKAIFFYRKLVLKHPNDYRWLMGYADALGGGDLVEGAYTPKGQYANKLYKRAWLLLNKKLNKHGMFKDFEEVNSYGYLAMRFGDADTLHRWLHKMDRFNGKTFNSRLIDILFYKEYIHLSHYLVEYYKNSSIRLENWIYLTAALMDGDTDQMLYLLENHAKSLPHRDRITAAEETGQIKLAEELAYEGMEQFPTDNNLYEIYKNLVTKYGSRWETIGAYRFLPNVEGYEVHALYESLIGFHSSLIAKTFNWFPKITNFTQIARAPHWIHEVFIGLKRYFNHSDLTFGLSNHHGFKNNLGGMIRYHFEPNHLTEITFEGGLNQNATDTVPLRIAGLNDYISAQLAYRLTARDLLNFILREDYFLGEDQSYLGNSLKSEFLYDHAFAFNYPDWHAGFSIVNETNSASSRALTPFMASFVPTDVIPNSNFFISEGSTSFYLMVSMGTRYADDYTHRWRPYLSANTSYNTVLGIGYAVNVGIAGTVIGRDHLALFSEYEKNSQQLGTTGESMYIGGKYTYYF